MFKIISQKESGKLQEGDMLQFDNYIGKAKFMCALSSSEILVKSSLNRTYRVQGLLLPNARVISN